MSALPSCKISLKVIEHHISKILPISKLMHLPEPSSMPSYVSWWAASSRLNKTWSKLTPI